MSFLAYIAFVVHGFLAGSDSGETWVRVMYVVSLSLISVLVLLRILSRTLLPKWRARRALSQQEFSQESSLPLA